MLDHCQEQCADVAGKLAQIFGWRHKYDVQRLQRANQVPNSKAVVITQVVSRKHSADSWVAVHSLQSQSDGGILDPDDRLNDVADDREQIIATFEDGEPPVHHGGDGASGSSVGSPSPDMFQGSDKYRTDIEVTDEQIASGTSLQVRRGSEPALNQLLPSTGTSNGHLPVVIEKTSKRWSAAPIIVEPRMPTRKDERGMNGHATERWGRNEREESPQRGFTRDGCRLSMQYLGDGPGGMKWMDAADRALNNRVQSLSLPRETRRKEPLGQATSSPTENDSTQYIVLDTESGALGIHVVPDYDSQGQDQGLLVQGIEPGGRVDRDGRLAVYDRIIEINGHNLLDQPFNVVQDIFRDSLRSPELRLRVVKHKPGVKKPPPPVYPKPPPPLHDRDAMAMVEGEERSVSTTTKVATVSPTKKLPTAQPGTHTLQLANTRKIGRKLELTLVKGPHGLGFSITTRDNPAGGNCPIYIKNILPKGAAVEDGRLRPGDRLLAVDGVELTGKSQSEAVALLRNVPPGGRVKIVVSRQDDTSPSPKSVDSGPESLNSSINSGIKPLEKEVKMSPQNQSRSSEPSQLDESGLYPWRQREILTFDIPVHDTEKAGLGVSVKGKTSANQNANPNSSNGSAIDLGIFVKNVIHGGAASRDGRLRTNDQLLNVNGVSLLGLSNAAAMDTLRKAMMRTDGPAHGCITLTVARRVPELRNCNGDSSTRRDSLSSLLTDSSGQTETFGGPGLDSHVTPDNSGASENSDNTVIFLPPYKQQHNHLDGVAMRNPVLERLTGQTHSQGLRNESYYRATHHTTMLLNNSSQLGSPTVNQPPPETVIIEEDSPYIPATVRRVEVDSSGMTPQRGSTSSTQTVDATYASQLSLEEAAAGFSRDAFGRQSMSEKRHATLDAKNTDTYQRNKKLREERERQRREELMKHGKISRDGATGMIRVNSAESIPRSDNDREALSKAQLGPSLGMKKSSSLESLQTMVQEIQMQEEVGTYRNAQGAIRVVRGRGCNESFRAAVDRSYDAPLSLRMEPLAEDDTEGGLGPRQSSLNTAMDCKMIKANKKKTGLSLKNLFKFGKHRKEGGSGSDIGVPGEEEREAARRAEQQRMREEQERIQEQYRRLMQRQQEMKQEVLHQREQSGGSEGPQSLGGSGSTGGGSGGEVTRTERIQQLRAQHQRRHAERHRQYPLDEKEERYEAALRQNITPPSYYRTVQEHYLKRLEGPEFDPSAMTRPGSRVGITDPARFSHYVNYQEIQQHLNSERDQVRLRRPAPPPPSATGDPSAADDSRRQQHYHSQRRDPREVSHRPVSNFYEYESVQAVLRGDGHSNSLPRRPDIAPTHGMSNNHRSSGSYGQPPRLYQPFLNQPQVYHTNNNQQQGYHHNNNNNNNTQRKPHGPFVTHVTIRESQSTSPNV